MKKARGSSIPNLRNKGIGKNLLSPSPVAEQTEG
jgi:hypothetical protein